MGQIIFLQLLLLLLLPHLPSFEADIITESSQPTMHFQDFYFSETGYVSISLTNIIIAPGANYHKSVNSSNIGFYLVEYNGKRHSKANDVCITKSLHLKHEAFTRVISFNELPSSPPPISILNVTVEVPQKGMYGVYFSNCEKAAVSMNVEIQAYDIDHDKQRSHLPYPTNYIRFMLDFYSQFNFEIVLLWAVICCTNMRHFWRIHLLISILFVMKYLCTTLLADNNRYGNLMGTLHLWDVAFYTLQSSQVVLENIVLMLIAFGWSVEKPYLRGKELKIFTQGSVIHILDAFGYILVTNICPNITGYRYWYWGFMLVDCLHGFWVVAPFTWSLESLKQSANEHGDAMGRILARTRLLEQMYRPIVLYQVLSKYFRLKAMMICSNDICFRDMSIEDNEWLTSVFYLLMLYAMQPKEDDFFLVVEEMDEVQLV